MNWRCKGKRATGRTVGGLMPRGRRHPGIGRPPISPTRRAKYCWREATGKHRERRRARTTQLPHYNCWKQCCLFFIPTSFWTFPSKRAPCAPLPPPKPETSNANPPPLILRPSLLNPRFPNSPPSNSHCFKPPHPFPSNPDPVVTLQTQHPKPLTKRRTGAAQRELRPGRHVGERAVLLSLR